MKRIISVILSLIFILSAFSEGFSAFAKNESQESAVSVFAKELSEIVRENDIDNKEETTDEVIDDVIITVDKFFSQISSDSSIYEGLPEDAFSTKRLIIKSKKAIDYQGAKDFVSGYNDLYVLQYNTQTEAKKAYEYYLKCDYIEYVEPDLLMNSQEEAYGEDVFDDLFPGIGDAATDISEWLSLKIGFTDIKDELATMIQDDYVMVAVIDSGVDTDHEHLNGRLVESDINLSSSGEENSCEDDYGHGTHVAGVITSNTLDNVKIKPYKVLNKTGSGSLSIISIAIDLAVADGADIINLSLTGEGESQRMTEAVDNAVANDINVVVASGNKGADLDDVYYSPACIPSAITVSATDKSNKLASYSNYDGTIDIAAIGSDIQSSYLDNKYVSLSGTSMAAPQVTAGLAIIYTAFSNKTALEAEEMLKEFAILMKENVGENHFGAGLLYLKYILGEKPTTFAPVISVESCDFTDSFKVELTCPENNANIYYVTYDAESILDINWLNASKYSGPITISSTCQLAAIAVVDGKKISEIVKASYNRIGESEEDYYEVNTFGLLTGYYGSKVDLIIPQTIRGKTVKGVASNAFKDNSVIRSVTLPETATNIGSNAFSGCTQLVSIKGEGVESIETSAFENSSVIEVDFENLSSIERKAFSNCRNLKKISFERVETIKSYAFQNAFSITELISDTLTDVGIYAFSSSGLQTVNLSSVTTVDLNAFSDCYNLTTVSMPNILSVSMNLFRNCISLKEIDISSATEICDNAFRNTAIEKFESDVVEKIGNYAFADNPVLSSIKLIKAMSAGISAFQNCTALQIVILPSIIKLNNDVFSNCTNLVALKLNTIKTIEKNVFRNSSIKFLRFEVVEEIKSLPSTLEGITLPSTVKFITADTPETDFIVYGYEDTYAQQYALMNNKSFHTVPDIYLESSSQVNVDEKYISVYALGFNCQYQWYRNDTVSNVGGTIIEGATRFYYEPSPDDNSAAYYCVITSNDGINISTVTTNPIENAPEYRDADYSEYNIVIQEANSLDRSSFDEDELKVLDELLLIDVSEYTYARQEEIDSIVTQIKNELEYLTAPYVMGDLNFDRNVTAIDVRIALKYVAGLCELSDKKLANGDMNGDGQVTAIDARMMLKKAAE